MFANIGTYDCDVHRAFAMCTLKPLTLRNLQW
uniref:Uncharacterized protein n=1 Tax=Myoviridae sp. ctu3o5 TaxID=2825198 RepID=A0A8S5U1M6_9CAUD|nr:MAG TPA: hypothetical protein [Myoviridae sp. ctu3o5]DAU09445.1 MAG TPA: hypothetical protein [Caudoviricetes sp.]